MKTKDKIPGGNPFKVPDNYFEGVSSRIISATTGELKEKKFRTVRMPMRQYIAIAASVAVLALLSYTGIKLFSPRRESFTLNNIPTEVYSDEILKDIDLVVLEENTSASGIPEEGLNLDDQDIIDYLIRENIDINDIYEKL
ncbi:MAG: hypothetical protein Q8868_06655 [Bacteroidota bacterium]|nr:hypothetical protein [Bacteroidota bacterium]